jgi:hypothetical protein
VFYIACRPIKLANQEETKVSMEILWSRRSESQRAACTLLFFQVGRVTVATEQTGAAPAQVLISGGRRSVDDRSRTTTCAEVILRLAQLSPRPLPHSLVSWSSSRRRRYVRWIGSYMHVHVAVAAGRWLISSIGGDESSAFPCRRSPPLDGGLETSTYPASSDRPAGCSK